MIDPLFTLAAGARVLRAALRDNRGREHGRRVAVAGLAGQQWGGVGRPVARVLGRQLSASLVTGPVLDLRSVSGWGNVGGNWAQSVLTGAATFEAWIRTTAKASQTIVIGSDPPGATPRISVGGDQISVYWNTGGSAPGWTSADTTPVTDGQWHHIAVVFDGGAITFYKDGVATADRLAAGRRSRRPGVSSSARGSARRPGSPASCMTCGCGRPHGRRSRSPPGAGRRCR